MGGDADDDADADADAEAEMFFTIPVILQHGCRRCHVAKTGAAFAYAGSVRKCLADGCR